MTESGSLSPAPFEPFTGSLTEPDAPLLREHFRDLTGWVIDDAVGDRLTGAERDALTDEIALILASSLAPALRREVQAQAEKMIAGLQTGPVSFGYDHQVKVDGFSAPELVQLIDAVGRLIDVGVGDTLWTLHETHRRILDRTHGRWVEKNSQADAGDAC